MKLDECAEMSEYPDDYIKGELNSAFSTIAINNKDTSIPPATPTQILTSPMEPSLTEEHIRAMTINQMKVELDMRGNPKFGKKSYGIGSILPLIHQYLSLQFNVMSQWPVSTSS